MMAEPTQKDVVDDGGMEQPSSSHDPPDLDVSMGTSDDLTVNTSLMLYRFIPIGSYALTFNDNSQLTASLTGSACGCCCDDGTACPIRNASQASLQVTHQTMCNFCRLIRDVALAFVAAFMFHLFVAVLWGVERSLGSSSNHVKMGYVWFGGWPVWFVILQFLRPWGIMVDSSTFVPFVSWKHATQVVEWWERAKSAGAASIPLPKKPKLFRDPWFLVGWFFLLFLVVNMIVTGVLVVQCNDRGCCKDNEDTLDCCVETGYPEC